MRGKTTLSPKSLLKNNMRSMILIGIMPRMGMVHLMSFRNSPNLLMSEENCLTRLLGKQFAQNASGPLPKETWRATAWGPWPYLRKKLKVCLNI